MATIKQIDIHLRQRDWTGAAVLFKNMQVYFQEKYKIDFDLMDYSTISLRDICKEAGYDYWWNHAHSTAIDGMDSAIAYFTYNK